MKLWPLILLNLSLHSIATAGWQEAKAISEKGRSSSIRTTRNIIIELVKGEYYFSAIPLMKEYMTKSSRLDADIEKAFDKILTHAGTEQFELLPIKFLNKSVSSSIRYLVAKKYLRQEQPQKSISHASKINPNHPVYPYAANLLGVAYSMMGKPKVAISQFKDCERISEQRTKKVKTRLERKQLIMNKDYCIMGIARSQFSNKKYKDADLTYLDIPKSSYVWPEVLFEEAWNSYYLKNYNRTLGKLVSYKAPVLKHIFNPEIDVLNALTYLKLCLYNDARKISDAFYKKHMEPARSLRLFLKRKGKNYKYFYRLMIDYEATKRSDSNLVESMLDSIAKDLSYSQLKFRLINLSKEVQKVGQLSKGKFRTTTLQNLKEVLVTQKNILGSYVRAGLIERYAQLYRAFEGMSYIKLEILAQKKAKLYNYDEKVRSRGDVKYIEQNEKQYFWDFNGEFWADELGDYVFALGEEC